MKDLVKIRQLAAENPDLALRLLGEGDVDIWDSVRRDVIEPFLASGTAYGNKLVDRGKTPDDAYSYVLKKLLQERKIDNLRDSRQVVAFILERVKEYAHSLYRKEKTELSIDRELEMPEATLERATRAVAETHAAEEGGELYSSVQEGFTHVWERNAQRAVVLLLSEVKGLSAREIQSFLQIASENYVNQVVFRAKANLREQLVPTPGREDGTC